MEYKIKYRYDDTSDVTTKIVEGTYERDQLLDSIKKHSTAVVISCSKILSPAAQFVEDVLNFFKSNQSKTTMQFTPKKVTTGILGFLGFIILMSSWYTVPEGHVYIVKLMGKAVRSEDPGLHFKIPILEGTTSMEIRTRKYSKAMSISTTGRSIDEKTGKERVELQMPSQVIISANWNVPKADALAIFIKYGSLEQFQSRILDPRVSRAAKGSFPNYSIEQIISNREAVTQDIRLALTNQLMGTSVSMTDINIEDIDYPENIKTAVNKKQVAKLAFEEERDILAKQNLVAQQKVNTATAEASAIRLNADAQAHATIVAGNAEAQAITAKAKALAKNPRIVQLVQAERWNGQLPTHSLGGKSSFLFGLNK